MKYSLQEALRELRNSKKSLNEGLKGKTMQNILNLLYPLGPVNIYKTGIYHHEFKLSSGHKQGWRSKGVKGLHNGWGYAPLDENKYYVTFKLIDIDKYFKCFVDEDSYNRCKNNTTTYKTFKEAVDKLNLNIIYLGGYKADYTFLIPGFKAIEDIVKESSLAIEEYLQNNGLENIKIKTYEYSGLISIDYENNPDSKLYKRKHPFADNEDNPISIKIKDLLLNKIDEFNISYVEDSGWPEMLNVYIKEPKITF